METDSDIYTLTFAQVPMADKTPEQEPSIEEILASIRQIISDDDEKEPGAEEPAAASASMPEPEPEIEPEPEEPEEEADDVLELTEAEAIPVEPPKPAAPAPKLPPEDPIEVDLQEIEEIEEEDVPAMPAPAPSSDDSILSDETRQSTIASMAKLASNTPINRPSHSAGSVTLEDIVREILNPMLRDWMDTNLPPMVERIVQKELEKLARQVMDE